MWLVIKRGRTPQFMHLPLHPLLGVLRPAFQPAPDRNQMKWNERCNRVENWVSVMAAAAAAGGLVERWRVWKKLPPLCNNVEIYELMRPATGNYELFRMIDACSGGNFKYICYGKIAHPGQRVTFRFFAITLVWFTVITWLKRCKWALDWGKSDL